MNRIRAHGAMPLILLTGLAVRVWGLGFGLPYGNARPDEILVAGAANQFLSGNFSPPSFQWPTLFPYLVAAGYLAYAVLGRPFTGFTSIAAFSQSRTYAFDPFLYIPRAISMTFGVATVWWIGAIGRQVFDATVGSVAALFLALALLPVRDAHFGVTDTPMTALVVASVLLILRWRRSGGLTSAIVAGIVSGLAASMKYNGLAVSTAFAAAWCLRFVEAPRSGQGARARVIVELTAYAAALLATLFGTSPFIVVEWPRFLSDITYLQSLLANGNGIVLGRGWWYFATVLLPAAIGWPMWIAGALGVVLLIATRARDTVVVLAFPLVYYAFVGRGQAVFARYILPVVPFLCLTAAWFVVSAARWLARSWTPAGQAGLAAALAVVVVTPTAINTVLLDRLLARTDNRVVTARVVVDAVPAGSSFFQTGDLSYGMPPFSDRRALDVHIAAYEVAAHSFSPRDPDWILVQRSPLTMYTPVPAGLEEILRDRYEIVRSFSTGPNVPGRLYDQQDALFLPLSKLRGVERPGPSFELYAKR